jgi:hypothetical protein
MTNDLGELTIFLRPHDHPYCYYVGTRMQLEAEGVIPPDTEWPEGFNDLRWESNGVRFRLNRMRPEGSKGPRRNFADCDNWCLHMERRDLDWVQDSLEKKSRELRELIYRQTPEWSKAWDETCRRLDAARGDEKFQALKALIPGLIPPPRKPRTSRRHLAATGPGDTV